MTDEPADGVIETEDGDVLVTAHAGLINRLIAAADRDQDGGIMLTPEGHPLAAIWPERLVDRFGTVTWIVHVLAADPTTTVEARHLDD